MAVEKNHRENKYWVAPAFYSSDLAKDQPKSETLLSKIKIQANEKGSIRNMNKQC